MDTTLKDFRRVLHAHPELSGHERETQKRIKAILASHGITDASDVGRFGTLYTFHFGDGPHLLVRVDIDALPIQETNDFSHRSVSEGISHKCGHDGHATIGVGLAIQLHTQPLLSGTVSVLFQPSEENGEGAQGVLNDAKFDADEYDYVVALHNIPGVALHNVLWRRGNFTPAVQSLVLRLQGKTSHAAEPLKGKNPTYAIAEMIGEALRLEETDEKHPSYRLITPVYSTIGSVDYGISAGYGEIHFTIRSWHQADMDRATEEFMVEVKRIAAHHSLELSTEIVAVFASNQNHDDVIDAIIASSDSLGLTLEEKSEPFPWGEDFGLFTQCIPGAMFGLGSGVNTAALHNPDYDYPDELTTTGVNLFYEISKTICTRV
ncbi:MAG: amidohydrolase [Cryomorphaceae bacterium]